MDPKDCSKSRRDFLKAGAASLAFTLVAGCGSDSAAIGTTGFLPSQQSIPTNVPTLTPRVTVEPEQFPGSDAGTLNVVTVRAAEGGQFTLSDGTKLVIPPGALPRDTEISVVVPSQRQDANFFQYIFKPSGLVFSTPIFVVVPHSLTDPQVLFAYDSSPANPMVNVPSEPNNWKKTRVVAADATSLTLALEHFTFLWALVNGDKSCYVVCDIPHRYLKPADVVFYLTGGIANASWQVGHVGMLTKNVGPFADKHEDNMVHSSGNTPVSVVAEPASEVALIDGHIYLGARRSKQALSETDIAQMLLFLSAQLGKDYSVIGDAGLPTDVFFDTWSCVGLVEYAFHTVGKDNLSFFRRDFIATPMELFRAMDPVEEIEVAAGEALEIPVYVAAQLAEDYINVLTAAYSRYPDRAPYAFQNSELPAGAVLENAGLRADRDGNRTPGYLFKWTPQPSQVGQTFNVTFSASTVRTGVLGVQHRGRNSYTLRMKVASAEWAVVYENIAADEYQVFGDIALNSTGSFAFATSIRTAQTSFTDKQIFAKLNDGPTTLIDTVEAFGGVDVSHQDNGGVGSNIVMNDNAEVAYVGVITPGVGAELRFKHPGLPVETLGVYSFLPNKLFPIDSENKSLLFKYRGADMASIDVRHPGAGPAPLGLKQLSGQNFEVVTSFSINTSGQAYVNGATNQSPARSTAFQYQYPLQDGTPASTTLLYGLQTNPPNRGHVLNEQGDLAYLEGFHIVIERKNQPLLRIPDDITIGYKQLFMHDNGDLYAIQQGNGSPKLVRFRRDNSPTPEIVSDALGRPDLNIVTYRVAGPYLMINSESSVTVFQERQV